MNRDLYADLGVPPTATAAELKAAWRRASKAHPDVGGDPERFSRAKAAYDFLADPSRRVIYDAARRAGPESDAHDTYDAAWESFDALWQKSVGDLLPHLAGLRTSARAGDWLLVAESSLGLLNKLRGKTGGRPAKKAAPAPEGELSVKLRQLRAAHDAGLLTPAEYETKRATVLASF